MSGGTEKSGIWAPCEHRTSYYSCHTDTDCCLPVFLGL